MRIRCVGLTNVSLIIFDPQFAVTAIFLSKSYNFDQNQFFMPEFHVICRICCSMSYFCSLSNPNSRFLAFLASKSYNFDQNRIFVAEFNVTGEYRFENVTLDDIKAEFAETAIFVPKCYITCRNQFFVPEFDGNRASLCWGSLSVISLWTFSMQDSP